MNTIFCKNDNSKNKYNNKTIIIMNNPTRNQNKCIFEGIFIIKGLQFPYERNSDSIKQRLK